MLNLKAKLTRAKPLKVSATRSLNTTIPPTNPGGASGSDAMPGKAKAKNRPDATMLILNFLKETPPDLVLELLVPYLLDQLLKRAGYLRQRRTEIEERQQELHRRQQDVSGVATGSAAEPTSHQGEVEPVKVVSDPTQPEGED